MTHLLLSAFETLSEVLLLGPLSCNFSEGNNTSRSPDPFPLSPWILVLPSMQSLFQEILLDRTSSGSRQLFLSCGPYLVYKEQSHI